VHVDRAETGAVEGRSHLHLAVDALLAQDGNLRAHAFLDEGAAMSSLTSKLSLTDRPGLSSSSSTSNLLGAVGVVAQALDLVAGLAHWRCSMRRCLRTRSPLKTMSI
jgi:hypothetical protein